MGNELKVYLSLSEEQVSPANGIGRVVLAQHKHLPKYGIKVVSDPEQADVIACHIIKGNLPRIDVLHSHGLYFSDIPHLTYKTWHHNANKDIIGAAREAITVTTPCTWVAEPFRRDMRINPVVIGHGVDYDEWQGARPGTGKYILYNKGRESDVCLSEPALELAKNGERVVSTFAPVGADIPDKMKVVGTMPFENMKRLIMDADIYLATTLETFGIGTVEALAAGVPVLGYRWGGTEDIVIHDECGYLVEPGDVQGLIDGAAYIRQHYRRMSEAARKRAQLYTWDTVMGQYADVYREAKDIREQEQTAGVSIVITNYNYSKWVGDAIESCKKQTKPPREIIVVDDGSTDGSVEYLKKIDGIKLILQKNQGVAHARDAGIMAAKGTFITCLDADDMLDPRFVATLSDALLADRGMGIAYSRMAIIDEQGKYKYTPDFPGEFSWEIQSKEGVPPPNVVPSGSMFRKSMWERAGGYRQEYAPGEDAEFWVRGLSVGFTAKRVSQDLLFWYRLHGGSASQTRKYVPIHDKLPFIMDKDFPMGAPSTTPPNVRSYHIPDVSIIIPVGPNHTRKVITAIDSVIGQTFRNWELILVDDTGGKLDEFRKHPRWKAYPFLKIFKTEKAGCGAGRARNIGLRHARGKTVVFLDADDYLLSDAIYKMWEGYQESGGRYVYTDYLLLDGEGIHRQYSKTYIQNEWHMQHSIVVMMDRNHAIDLMFDETLESWEDWDFFIRAAIKGYCGIRLAEPVFVYRLFTGKRRMVMLDEHGITDSARDVLNYFSKKYGKYYTGESLMARCCGGNGGEVIIKAKNAILRAGELPVSEEGVPMASTSNLVILEYIGTNVGAIGFKANNRTYRGGNNPRDRYVEVPVEDVQSLVMTGRWRKVEQPVQPSQPPQTGDKPQAQQQPVRKAITMREAEEAARRALEQAKGGFHDDLPEIDETVFKKVSDKVVQGKEEDEEPKPSDPMTAFKVPGETTPEKKQTRSKKDKK